MHALDTKYTILNFLTCPNLYMLKKSKHFSLKKIFITIYLDTCKKLECDTKKNEMLTSGLRAFDKEF